MHKCLAFPVHVIIRPLPLAIKGVLFCFACGTEFYLKNPTPQGAAQATSMVVARNFIRRTQPNREPPTRPNWAL
jgi:hypothetical protein